MSVATGGTSPCSCEAAMSVPAGGAAIPVFASVIIDSEAWKEQGPNKIMSSQMVAFLKSFFLSLRGRGLMDNLAASDRSLALILINTGTFLLNIRVLTFLSCGCPKINSILCMKVLANSLSSLMLLRSFRSVIVLGFSILYLH